MRLYLVITTFLFSFSVYSSEKLNKPDYGISWQIAKDTLESNIVTLPSGPYLRAGGTHFGSLWTRDFAWSAGGLMAINREDVIKNHINALVESRDKNGLVPRVLDSTSSASRVFWGVVTGRHGRELSDPLRPEYLGEHSTVAIDSNLLVIMASLQLATRNFDHKFQDWWWNHLDSWIDLYKFYESSKNGIFITQEKYGDWQDSVSRSGVTFLTNLLYWHISDQILEYLGKEQAYKYFAISEKKQDKLLLKLWDYFWDENQGLFLSHKELDTFSLDGNLLVLKNKKFFKRSESLGILHSYTYNDFTYEFYENLKSSPLWSKWDIPGMASFPDYPSNWVSWTTRIVGLTHYHDQMIWTWLTGLSLEIASSMQDKDEAERIIQELQKRLIRDNTVTEILSPQEELPPFRSFIYRSEQPFSWGAALILQGLERYANSFKTAP